MTNVIYRTDKGMWYEAGLAKRELAFFRSRNKPDLFKEAIEKNEALISQFIGSEAASLAA